MKNFKKFLNKGTDIIYTFVSKLANKIKDEESTYYIKAIIKLSLLLLTYFVCWIIADGLINGGTYIIYQTASTGRRILSGIWNIGVVLTYFLFIIISLYKTINLSKNDSKFLMSHKNKDKDKITKKKIIFTVKTIIKILGVIILIPLFVGNVLSLLFLGLLFGYLRKKIYLISLFILAVGLILFFTTSIILIKKVMSNPKVNFKKYVIVIITSVLVIGGSFIGILGETSSYKIDHNLTTDFKLLTIKNEYKMDLTKDYVIYNNDNDKNLELIIDDDLGSYLEITIRYIKTSKINTDIYFEENEVKIYNEQELNIQPEDIENIINLGVSCISDKTIYNYNLLKYAKIEVKVSSKYASKIKFVNLNGKEYIPYERNNK